ncbi:Protein inturned, partial [Geodia barretti]
NPHAFPFPTNAAATEHGVSSRDGKKTLESVRRIYTIRRVREREARMNARRRLKLSSLSFSLPDVSEVGYTPSPSYYPPAQEILEEPEEAEEREVDEESGPGSYRVGDTVREKEEDWVDATDPVSGSVFFVNSASLPRPHPNGSAIIPSTSSSSLSSSTTSLSHPHPLSSLTSSPCPRRSSSFTTSLPPTPNDAFFSSSFAGPPSLPPLPPHRPVTPSTSISSSALPSPTNSQNIDEFFVSGSYFRESVDGDSAHCPSPCPSEGWMPKSVSSSSMGGGSVRWRMRRKWKKMVGRGDKMRGRSYSHGLMPSDSVPNLSCDMEYAHHPPSSVPPSPPHGELFGSQDLPLEGGAHGTIVTARVSLKPHPLAGRPHRHWNLEKLGIIPARALGGKRYRSFTNLRFAFKNHYPQGSSSLSNSLVIRGIIPGTPASLAPQLQQGDTILAINGHAVFLETANSILRAQSREVELVFIVKKRTHVGSTFTSTPAHHHLLTSSRHGNLVRLVSGKETTSSRHHRHSPPFLFLCLTLDTKEEDPADKDILYCYPTEARDWSTASGEGVRSEEVRSEEVTALLMKLRGVFLTLSDVMGSITADSHSCSTVEVRGRPFHCAHVQRGKEVLLLALPASLLPRHLLLATTIRLEHTLRLLFHSPQSVFPPEDHSNVNHVLSLLFLHLSSHSPYPHWPHPLRISPLTGVIAAHSSEPYPVETVLRVSEALDELETATPSYHLTDLAHSPRTFFPRGSALFHQGRLVVSHLQLASLSKWLFSVNLIVFWRYRLSNQDPLLSYGERSICTSLQVLRLRMWK